MHIVEPSRIQYGPTLTDAVAAVEAELPGAAALHQPIRSRQVVSLGDDPDVLSTDVRREP